MRQDQGRCRVVSNGVADDTPESVRVAQEEFHTTGDLRRFVRAIARDVILNRIDTGRAGKAIQGIREDLKGLQLEMAAARNEMSPRHIPLDNAAA